MTYWRDGVEIRATHEHWTILDQIMGKKQAHEERVRVFSTVPCTYCGALAGERCRTDRDVPTANYGEHQSRRRNPVAIKAWDDFVLEKTDAILQQRMASIRATEIANAPTHRVLQPSAVALGELQLRRKRRIDVVLQEDDRPLAQRLGDLAAAVKNARLREEHAWSAAYAATAELDRLESEYAATMKEAAAAFASGDGEALMNPGGSR